MATLQASPERTIDRNATTLQMRVPVFAPAPLRQAQRKWWMAGRVSDVLRLVIIGGFVITVGLFAYFMPPVEAGEPAVPAAQGQLP